MGDKLTALNEKGAAHLGLGGVLVDAARAASRGCVAVRAEGPKGGVRLLLAAPVARGAQVLILDVTWVVDPARLSALAPTLTAREREVVTLLVQGLGPGHVAERLGITWHTARSHVRNIHRVLRIKDRADVAKLGQALLTLQVDGWAQGPDPP